MPPTTRLPFGSPEDLVAEGVARAVLVIERWTEEVLDAVEGVTRPDVIIDRAMLALAHVPDAELGELAADVGTRGAMLGALDADWETTREVRVDPARFDRTVALPSGDEFTLRPFEEAIADFQGREAVTKDVWLRMTGEERKRAFTVAYLAKLDMVEAVQSELQRSLEEGTDLRHFRKLMRLRFEERGWSPLNPTHVETVFRTNVVGSYARGRRAQMTQPLMLKLRPFWQIFTVADARRRPTHGAMHGKAVRAEDPFWTRAPLPWGFNCRCRVVARAEKWIEKNGVAVVEGSTITGLPDPGFEPHGAMAQVPAAVQVPPPPPPAPVAPPPPPPKAPAQPKASFAVGKHVFGVTARGRAAQATQRELAATLERDHQALLGLLAIRPMSHLRFDTRGPRGVMGSFLPRNGAVYVRAARKAYTYGSQIQGAWSVSSAAKTPEEAELRTFVHESAHHFHYGSSKVARLIDAAWKKWVQTGSNPAVTMYARKNEAEYFAESFAAYHFEPAHLRAADPDAFSMVEQAIKELEKP